MPVAQGQPAWSSQRQRKPAFTSDCNTNGCFSAPLTQHFMSRLLSPLLKLEKGPLHLGLDMQGKAGLSLLFLP